MKECSYGMGSWKYVLSKERLWQWLWCSWAHTMHDVFLRCGNRCGRQRGYCPQSRPHSYRCYPHCDEKHCEYWHCDICHPCGEELQRLLDSLPKKRPVGAFTEEELVRLTQLPPSVPDVYVKEDDDL